MEQVGYSLVDGNGTEIIGWGDTLGVVVGIPDRIFIPGDLDVYGAKSGDQLGAYKLVPRMMQNGASAGTAFDGTNIVITRLVTIDMVAAERNRRLAAGFNYDFGDARGVHHIGTTPADMDGWNEVTSYAGALRDAGDVTTQINIATNTGITHVTSAEWAAIELAAAQFRQPLWAKSFALMAQNPIPADYANDSYWT